MKSSRCVRLAGAFAALSAIANPAAMLRAQSLFEPVVTQVASGGSHSCAVTAAGGVKCWGDNTYGQLGDGTTISRPLPVAVSGLGSGVVSVAAGNEHSCAVLATGAVKCWGHNDSGQLGNNDATLTDSAVPVLVVDAGNAPIGRAVTATAGRAHTCIINLLGSVECWGYNGDGELGPPNIMAYSTTPVSVSYLADFELFIPITGVVAISSGASHTCALLTSGGVDCWGDNYYGQLGNGEAGGSTFYADGPFHAQIAGATGISAGGFHTCALIAGGARCWGYNGSGQLGNNDGGFASSASPVVVVDAGNVPLSGIAALSSRWYHSCALMTDGTLRCWGSNFLGELGNPAFAIALAAVPAVEADGSPIGGIGSIASGGSHTCAVTISGGVRCWGQNRAGQVGTGAAESTPNVVAGLGGGVVKVSSGIYQSCALTGAGTIWCWGNNLNGQLGNGSNQTSSAPVQVAGLGGVSAVAVGGYHTCALVSGGVKCWGSGLALGNNGNGFDSYTPVQVVDSGNAPISGATAVASGQGHSCALLGGGTVKCWGNNVSGQLGNNDNTLANQIFAVDVVDNGNVPISGVTAIAAGDSHTCAVKGGGVLCWGDNSAGALGINNIEISSSLTPLAVVDGNGPISGVSAVSAGSAFTCARLGSGGAKCWGYNGNGNLGNNSFATSYGAIDVLDSNANPLTGVASITAGYIHACVITTSGGAKCWGYNGYGDLGNPSDSYRLVATAVVDANNTPVTGLSTLPAGAISAGAYHTCARTQAGAAQCWGLNNVGQLGRGFFSYTPTAVAGFSGSATSIAAGDSHTCARTPAGSVKCWGFNQYGQLGNSDNGGADKSTPVAVVNAGGAAELGLGDITTGADHSCALTPAGGIECWGDNSNGQLGNNDSSGTKRTTPVAVVDSGNVPVGGITAVAAGAFHTCALQASGRILCWGDNGNGQLGNNDGTLANRYTPVNVVDASNTAVSGATAIAAGGYYTCALFSGGAVSCWGDNSKAQLGIGSTGGQSLIPLAVSTLGSGVTAIATGVFHACAVIGGGAAKCWGYNNRGQLGDNSTTTRNVPVAVSGLASGVARISAGQFHSCATIAGNTAKCWGDDSKGQLGINTIGGQSLVPVGVTGLTSVAALAAGGLHTCAVTSAGAVRCWGNNSAGQLGDGSTTTRPLPTNLLDGQNIAFVTPKSRGLGTLTLGALASSGLPATYDTWTSSICTISGNTLTANAYGICGVRASQGGNGTSIAAAPQQLRLIVISNEIFRDGFE